MKRIIIALCLFLTSMTVLAQGLDSIRVVGVIDGDTLRAVIVGFPEPLRNISIRIMGIDTPEIKAKCSNEKVKAQEAKTFLINQLRVTQKVTLQNVTWDKYGGRILAEVLFDDRNIADIMITKGLAIPYYGKKKTYSWCVPPIDLP